MNIKKKSDWIFDGSSGGDLGILMASFKKGTIKLKKPGSAADRMTLYYNAAGVGKSKGLPIGLSFSTPEMPSFGDVYVTDNVSGDLTPSDFEGLAFIHDVSFNLGGMGASQTILFVGIPWASLPTGLIKGIASNLIDIKSFLLGPLYNIYKAGKFIIGRSDDVPGLLRPLVGNAKGIIILKGQAVGPAMTVGGSILYGYISSESDEAPWEIHFPKSHEEPSSTYKNTSQVDSVTRIPGDLLFAFDKDWIGSGKGGIAAAESVLSMIAFMLRTIRPRFIFVEGHTDSVGPPTYNLNLSRQRGEAVSKWLRIKGHLASASITVIGFGLTKPISSNGSPAGRELNRRVEIRFLR